MAEKVSFIEHSKQKLSSKDFNFEEISFVCGNIKKISEAQAILVQDGIKLNYINMDLPEYQGDADFVCRSKCIEAARCVNGPVIVEDTSLAFTALKGLPGPYIKWFYEKLGSDGLFKLLAGFEDKTATAVCTLAFTQGANKEIHLFRGIANGSIVPPKGDHGFGWDSCFLPQGLTRTFAELTSEEKNAISHRTKALNALKVYLK